MSNSDPTEIESNGGDSWFEDVSVDELYANQDAPNGEDLAAAGPPLKPIPQPFPLPKRPVSGRYRGSSGAFQLELRVDVDRTRPMNRVSADFFQVSGGTTTYSGSFIVNSPVVTVSASQVVIKGLGNFTFSAGAPVVQVTIPRRTIFQPQAPAALQFFTTSNRPAPCIPVLSSRSGSGRRGSKPTVYPTWRAPCSAPITPARCRQAARPAT
jgi:hypothetical protein